MDASQQQLRMAKGWGAVAVAGAVATVFPFVTGVPDGMNGGFALAFVGVVVAIVAAVVAWFYLARARAARRIQGGDDLVAHFSYSAEQWSAWAAAQSRREASQQKLLFGMVAAIALPIGLVFWLADPRRGGQVVLATMVGLLVLIFAVIKLVARATAKRRRNTGEAWVGTGGILLGNELHTWDSMGGRLEGASLEGDESGRLLSVTYSMPARHGRQRTTVNVPVPRGGEAEAEKARLVLQAAVD